MKFCNIRTDGELHLAMECSRGTVDISSSGLSMEALLSGADRAVLTALEKDESLPLVTDPEFGPVLKKPGKLVCVGLNYRSHAIACGEALPTAPLLFTKVDTSFAACGEPITLPPWENSYDYEAELVIVIGREAWNVNESEAEDCIFGYTCGNDLSCRDAQMRGSQWLIGKCMPGFGPCGPWIVSADSFDPEKDHYVRSFVNGEMRQNGVTTDLIFSCRQIVSYASRYMRLCPGDLIFTGTPSGPAIESEAIAWLRPGDVVEIEIEGIGRLTNPMV